MGARLEVLPFTGAELAGVLTSERGMTEWPPGSNHVKYAVQQGIDGQPWCAAFIGWGWDELSHHLGAWRAFWHELGSDLSYYTPSINRAGQAAGLAVPIASARAGDLILLDFPDSERGVQHIEVGRAGWAGDLLPTIGGNTSTDERGSQDNGGGVYKKQRTAGPIVSVLRPPYTPATPARPAPAPRPPTYVLRSTLRKGSTGSGVRAVQTRLGVTVDGVYGDVTRAAVLAFQRRYFRAPSAHDGIVGPQTARALGLVWAG